MNSISKLNSNFKWRTQAWSAVISREISGDLSKMAPDQGSDFKMIDSSIDWGGLIRNFEIIIVPVDGLAPIGARTSAGTLLTKLSSVYTRPGTWRQAWYQHAIIMVEINYWLSMMPNGHVLLATLLGPTAHAVRFSPTEFGQAGRAASVSTKVYEFIHRSLTPVKWSQYSLHHP